MKEQVCPCCGNEEPLFRRKFKELAEQLKAKEELRGACVRKPNVRFSDEERKYFNENIDEIIMLRFKKMTMNPTPFEKELLLEAYSEKEKK